MRFLVVGLVLLLVACGSQSDALRISGETMGTTYNIVAFDRQGRLDAGEVRAAVEATLAEVNARMSNWDERSEVSRFNAYAGTGPFEISAELAAVMRTAGEVHADSLGRFDVTVAPLIELWGFGARRPDSPVPSDEAIAQAQTLVGQSRLLSLATDPFSLTKREPEATVYLAAIAKGYGVDEVAATLNRLGLNDFMVEIGGDLITSGTNPDGNRWRIGIERPHEGSRRVEQIIDLTGLGMATSGDYRNYFEQGGVRYSHIIDPQTGRPVTHTTASVTVVAETAMLADAWATALLVLGQEKGLELAERLNLATLFIARDISSDETRFVVTASTRFRALQRGESRATPGDSEK